ncbi:T9SS type A sorting domain-containing protein [Hymenobacter yonginensis]|uniref:T9SS type A sorting domain-containing protein n=1 Tax=Hymenobacter yonginensis TaxID=748197 RepID=A0ABY7PJT7_9BACT|nr:T9SS type A sorting domain-containing protein [Hymenobacter yonginensis]WBO82996.1 T9SS type A sorting domain-containing protein [Hymenobacter yonginensis]
MKSLLPVAAGILALFSSSGAVAQQAIPNGTLETWSQRGLFESPQSWLTFDDIISALVGPLPFSTNTTVKSTDKRGGSFAAKLETQNFQDNFPGVLLLGTRIGNTNTLGGGIPYTNRPANLQFYYKMTGPAADSAGVQVALFKTVNGNPEIVADAFQILAPQAGYTLVTLPLTYRRADTPDTLQIFFASGLANNITAGTALFIDDVSLTGTVQAAKNPALDAALTVYPNPSPSGEFRLSSVANPAVATAPYTLSDATGRVVRTATAAPLGTAGGRPVDLRGLPAGVYLLQLNTPDGPVTRKLIR